ncbi:MAG: hypothetical protein LIO45_00535 [Clostridiales bacterium]|nr:hypothetical protein [Clostridiales bacterium]
MTFWFFYDLIFLAAGCYGLYLCAKSKATGELESVKVILPKKLRLSECKDPDAFLAKLRPNLATVSVIVLAYAAISMAEDMGAEFPSWTGIASMILIIAAAVVYIVLQSRLVNQFWDIEDERKR